SGRAVIELESEIAARNDGRDGKVARRIVVEIRVDAAVRRPDRHCIKYAFGRGQRDRWRRAGTLSRQGHRLRAALGVIRKGYTASTRAHRRGRKGHLQVALL